MNQQNWRISGDLFFLFFLSGGGDDYHTARVCFLKTNFVVMGKSGRDRGKNSQSIACPEDPFPSVGNSQICLCFTIDYRLMQQINTTSLSMNDITNIDCKSRGK